MSGDGLGLFSIEEVERLCRENAGMRLRMTRWANTGIDELVAAEREACARLADERVDEAPRAADGIAKAIRARNKD